MTQKPLPSDIDQPNRIEAAPAVGAGQEEIGTPNQSFSSFMETPSQASQSAKTQMASPFDLAQGPRQTLGTPSIDTLMSQVQLANSTLSGMQSQLSYPNLKIKSSQRYVIKNKLADASTNIRAANAKMGIPMANEPTPAKGTGPLAQFLNYVTDGMNQMESAKQQLSDLKNKGQSLSPGDFLLIQIKLNKAQQELDFTSVLLSKAVEDFKSLMNIQI